MKKIINFLLFALVFCGHASAFELKGINLGDDISSTDLKQCKPVPDADSGIPGYRCDTTFGGTPAVMMLIVTEQKIAAIKIIVEGQIMSPIRDALQEKYGSPSKPNRYIEDYNWSRGEKFLSIKESRMTRGYAVLAIDWVLVNTFNNKTKNKAKNDL